ncbi:MAG: hypothetical protein K8F25_12035 [Fimbriimonadaceae bacterium]|nr:hypothetical protein [Alphaproteobacteria bacterium]
MANANLKHHRENAHALTAPAPARSSIVELTSTDFIQSNPVFRGSAAILNEYTGYRGLFNNINHNLQNTSPDIFSCLN